MSTRSAIFTGQPTLLQGGSRVVRCRAGVHGEHRLRSPTILLPVNGEWLHAPTAAILHQFREIVLHRRMTRVAHLGQPVSATR
jgi:hypothetical protein